jgi:hypothetical protein
MQKIGAMVSSRSVGGFAALIQGADDVNFYGSYWGAAELNYWVDTDFMLSSGMRSIRSANGSMPALSGCAATRNV